MTKKAIYAGILAALFAIAQAGAAGLGSHDLPGEQARTDLKVRAGVVIDVQTVTLEIEATKNQRMAGGVVGALAGMAIGKQAGDWQTQGLAGGVGALAGDAIARTAGAESREALQVVVQLDSGGAVAIAQTMDNPLAVGQRVFLIGEGKTVRAVPARN